MRKYTLILGAVAVASMLFTSCNDDDNDNRGGSGDAGPASASSFEGATIRTSDGYTVMFTAGGNYSAYGTDPGDPTINDPEVGTFTYQATSPDFTTGILRLSYVEPEDGPQVDEVRLSNFVTVDGFVQSFTVRDEDGTIAVTVEGYLPAAIIAGDDGDGIATGGESFSYSPTDGHIAEGTVFSKSFLGQNVAQNDISGSPLKSYTPGQNGSFSIGSGGSLDFAGKSGPVSLPFSGASNGILRWDGASGGGTVTAVFDTKPTTAPADLIITWTDVSNLNAIAIDGKGFSN